jgi:isoleucyl-tRNA synthetase
LLAPTAIDTMTTAPVFEKVPANADFPALEERILKLWERLDAFQESNRRREGGQGKGEFVFYDGPPFATGAPHYGHLLAGTIKDIVPRYWNMRGYHVERRFGWDCHGLPIENLAQKELGWQGAPEIRKNGVEVFNEQCRSMVQTYVGEWRKTVTRMGRWVDFDHDYKTMDRDFMESVWWVFKRLWDQPGRVYKSFRVMPYSWKLTTPLSNFEAGNNYKDVQDPAITLRFRLRGPEVRKSRSPEVDAAISAGKAYALAWTTTPWTLPSNLALCVGPAINYVFVEDAQTKDVYLLAKERLAVYYKKPDQYRVLDEVAGVDLVGQRYEPLFPYLATGWGKNGFRVIADGFVSTGDGTGIVHIAPAYGEDDFRVAESASIVLGSRPLPKRILAGEYGFLEDVDLASLSPAQLSQIKRLHPVGDLLDWEGGFDGGTLAFSMYDVSGWAKDHLVGQICFETNKAIIKCLKDEEKLVHQSTILHSYPFCERTDTRLIYRAIEAWYVRVEDLRDKLAANNAKIRWVPEAVGANRFGNWLKEARDWNISRNRFWGSCMPVWVNTADSADTICVGSVEELEKLSGQKVTDLHKHVLDRIEIHQGGKTYLRTPEVLDCWFESGAMPYAQIHWLGGADGRQPPPNFPAQFIAEGLDQTRGWFYTLLVLSTALFDQPAFKNVVVNGMILAEDGQKMSKSKKNYPDPNLVLDQYGADALRAYLIDSPVVRADPLRFSEAGLKEIIRTVVLPYWNALSFFTTYASVDGFNPKSEDWKAQNYAERPKMDHWVLTELDSLVDDVNMEMKEYRLYNVVPRLVRFIDDLTNWYIRVSRRRFWKNDDHKDQANAYHTLYEVLNTFTKVLAPFMPFVTERAYQELEVRIDPDTLIKSVHWCDYPKAREPKFANTLPRETFQRVARLMSWVQRAVNLGRKLREDNRLKVRQPLPSITVIHRDLAVREAIRTFEEIIKSELNVKDVFPSADEGAFAAITVKPNFAELRKRCGPKLKQIGAALGKWGHAEVTRLEAGEKLDCCGEPLGAADVILQRTAKAGAVVATDGELTVALDTALTDELKAEGLAREFTSVLQQGRKTAGLEVSDRIRVRWHSPDAEVVAAVTTHAKAIADEILAVAFDQAQAELPTGDDLNGRPVSYTIEKA